MKSQVIPMRTRFWVALPGAVALCLAAAMPLIAHHAFGGEFDPNPNSSFREKPMI